MDVTFLIGLAAAVVILISQVPQVYKSFKSKQTKDLSLAMICLLFTGASLWLLYGILKPDTIIIFANGIMLAILCVLLALKLRYK